MITVVWSQEGSFYELANSIESFAFLFFVSSYLGKTQSDKITQSNNYLPLLFPLQDLILLKKKKNSRAAEKWRRQKEPETASRIEDKIANNHDHLKKDGSFVLSRAWHKEKDLGFHEESSLRPSDFVLQCSTTEQQRLYNGQANTSSYVTRVRHSAW